MFQRVRTHDPHVWKNSSRQAGRQACMGLEQELKTCILVHKSQAERELRMVSAFDIWKTTPNDKPPLTSLYQQGPQTISSTEDKEFKYMSLWGLFSFKPLHIYTCIRTYTHNAYTHCSPSLVLNMREIWDICLSWVKLISSAYKALKEIE